MVVGPAAGGVLAERPVNSLFRRYPYALPNIFAAGLALCALCVIEAWLPGKSSYASVAKDDADATDGDGDDAPAPRRGGACARVPRTSWLPIGVYCFLSTFSIFYEDCYPLWLLTPRDEGGMGNRDPRTWSVVYAEPAAGGNLTTAALERPILFEV